MVTHEEYISKHAHRIIRLKDGEVEQIGTPRQVLTQEQLSKSYGCTLLVDENPLLGTPRVSLVSEKIAAAIKNEKVEL